MRVSVPKEIMPGERRVALVPDGVTRLAKLGIDVAVERGAGERAGFPDEAYRQAGATIVADAAEAYGQAEVVVKVRKPIHNEQLGRHELELMREGAALIGLLDPLRDPELPRALADRRVTGLSLDAIPRITRAQDMDVLSSQATVAGYKAALIAANSLGRFFPMLVTAAGTIAPARVLVLGAGVAGLQAIATSRRLGAVVEAFDVRPAVKEQVESLGASFIAADLDEEVETEGGYARSLAEEAQERERAVIHRHIRNADAVITTAQVPGGAAPLLITEAMVRDMKPGSVIVDLAAETGGNCELTRLGEEVERHGVRVIGAVNLPSGIPFHASEMFSRNVSRLLALLIEDGKLRLDFEDEIVKGCCVTHEGRILIEAVKV